MRFPDVQMLLFTSFISLVRPLPLNISYSPTVPMPTGNLTQEQRYTDEQRLLYHLMQDYEKAVRPVRNASHTVTVRLGMTMTNIFDMDERNQVLTINVWLDQEWNDELLRWNPDDFGGIESLRIPCDLIWLPDIVLYNNADDYTVGYMRSRAMVLYTGTVFWPPPTQLRSTCKVDVSLFPFDEQRCSLKFGSWTYHGFQVDITNRSSNIDLTNYVPSGEFDLVKVYQKRRVVKYTCCPEPYPDITFFIHIRRKTLYYLYNIVFPCLMMSVLTLLVFILPPDSGEKIALGITVLLAFSVFVLAIAEKMPETSDSMPLIGIYLTVVMGMTSVSVVMTVLVLNCHHRGPFNEPVPNWARVLVLDRLRRFLRMKLSDRGNTARGSVCSNSVMRQMSVRVAMEDMKNEIINEMHPDLLNGGKAVADPTPFESLLRDVPHAEIAVDSNGVVRKRPRTGDDLQVKLLRTLQILIKRQENEDASEQMANEWRHVAQVISSLH
ncbi:Nicotinic acetylcholine receptor subunit type D [Trichostrongylus colubriformis]|uniref:Nicotinic acetylcholine receptor subunit type D n=1 Tax=Trichostrongylus colubriformis TaxID=6319 RepID=A0AAN8FAA7_TRICO